MPSKVYGARKAGASKRPMNKKNNILPIMTIHYGHKTECNFKKVKQLVIEGELRKTGHEGLMGSGASLENLPKSSTNV